MLVRRGEGALGAKPPGSRAADEAINRVREGRPNRPQSPSGHMRSEGANGGGFDLRRMRRRFEVDHRGKRRTAQGFGEAAGGDRTLQRRELQGRFGTQVPEDPTHRPVAQSARSIVKQHGSRHAGQAKWGPRMPAERARYSRSMSATMSAAGGRSARREAT